MNMRRLFSAVSFALVALPFFASGCASSEEEPSPESTEVKDVVAAEEVGVEPNACYMCYRCPSSGGIICALGSPWAACEEKCPVACVWHSTDCSN